MKYSEVIFICTAEGGWQQDVLIADLASLGFDTFEETEDGFSAFIPSHQLNVDQLEILLLQQPVDFHVTYQVREIEHQNWNEIWESNFQPITIDDQCYVRATFHPAKPEYPHEIVIDPKMAFGTGHHQTTSLMMRYLLQTAVQDLRVLDMGCGTGILAILAAKLGAKTVMAIDNDPVCVSSVAENVQLNQVSDITIGLGSYEAIGTHRFDLILANINRNVLLDQLPTYERALEEGGVLLMSGFYDGDDLRIIREAGEKIKLQFVDYLRQDDWVAAKFSKVK